MRGGLRDFSISRSSAAMSWGIPLPQDATHNTYVWYAPWTLGLLGVACADTATVVCLALHSGLLWMLLLQRRRHHSLCATNTVQSAPCCQVSTFHTCRFDALTGYLSALLRGDSGSNGSGSSLDAAAAGGWPATHIIGKDILRFHAVCTFAVPPSV